MGLKEQYELEEAAAKRAAALYAIQPHRQWGVRVYREGSQWVCSLDHHMDRNQCVVAFGPSPRAACIAFDELWYNGLPEEEEEEMY